MTSAFMAAWPYGTPKILSGYLFNGSNDAPPQVNGAIAPHDCNDANGNLWTCTHRWRPVAAATLWRAVTSGSSTVDNVFTQGTTVVGYSRSGKGYILFNTNSNAITVTVSTGLPAGKYCDTASGDFIPPSGCSGNTITVGTDGKAEISVPSYYISVFHMKSEISNSKSLRGNLNDSAVNL